MSSFDNDWFSFGGDARPGRVPGQVIVKGPKGYQLTAGQRGEFSQVLRQFTTSVRTSPIPDGFHTKRMRLGDGSRIEMVANNGVYQTVVYPVVGGGGAPPGFGGFTFLPAYAYWTRPASNVRWRIDDIFTGGVVAVPKYKADKPPTEVKDKLFQWRSFDQIPGARSWDCQGLYPGGRLNWRGPPTKYFAFGDYPDWYGLSCAGVYPYPAHLESHTPIVEFLHRPSEMLWIDGTPKTTAVKYIFSACLHRPDPAADIVSGNTVVRIFGAQARGLNGGAVFRVFDLGPANVSPTSCTLQDIKGATELVIYAEYELPGDYETDAIFLPPQHVDHWKFLYAPEFDRTGSRMAAAISRRTFKYFVNRGEPYGFQAPFYFSSVCEVDPTTFAISNERWSHGPVPSPFPGPYPATTPNTRYVGCDYLGDEFVTLWVSGVSGTSGSPHTLQHSKHGAIFTSLNGAEFSAVADLAKDFIYVIASLGENDPSLSEHEYGIRSPYSTPSHDAYFRGKYIHLSGPSILSADAPEGAVTTERTDPPIVVGIPYPMSDGTQGITYSGDRSLPLHGQVAVVGNNWSEAHWVGDTPGPSFTWDSELGRMDVVGYSVLDGVMDMNTKVSITDTRPGGPYMPGIFAQFYTTVALAGSAFGESLRRLRSYRAYAFTKDGDGVFLSSSPDPHPNNFVYELRLSPRLPLSVGAAWFVRIYPEVPEPPPAGEAGFIAWPSPDAWVSATPRTPATVYFHIAPVFK